LCRTSTSFFDNSKQGVDGRDKPDKPGHDAESGSFDKKVSITA
jgi:hypothetical protein